MNDIAKATGAAAVNTGRLADDPTPRRTLFWTQVSLGAVVLTLLATLAIPLLQSIGDAKKESEHRRQLHEQHNDELRREDALIEILRVVTKKSGGFDSLNVKRGTKPSGQNSAQIRGVTSSP